MSCPGQLSRMRASISACVARSATVTRSTSPLYSMATRRRKCSISSAPASRAISDIWGMNSSWLTAVLFLFRDVRDLVFEDEKVGSAGAREPHHILIVILDPAAHRLAGGQAQADRVLPLTQRLQVFGFVVRFFG